MTAKKTKAPKTADAGIIAYKAFNHDLTCRGFQYEVGKTYVHDGKIKCCDAGFHSCADPLDVLSYYDITDDIRFARVKASGKIDKRSDGDSKIASAEIHIEAELKLPEFIGIAIKWVADACKAKDAEGQITDGHYAKNASSGDYAKNASSGDYATNASSGHSAKNASSGHYATNASSGHSATNASGGGCATNASSGDYAKNASSGDYATNASSGHSAKNASSGHYATNASSGDYATNASSGDYAKNASSGHSATNASSEHYAKNASSGDYAKNASSGHYATNASSGDYAKNASSGDYATNASSGHSGSNEASGEHAVISGAGRDTRYKGAKGVWISAAEYKRVGSARQCCGFAIGQAGHDGVPADTWLIAKGGKLVPA